MYASAEHIGRSLICPDCEARVKIRPPPPKPASQRPQWTGDEYRLADAGGDSPPAQPESVSVTCGTCFTLMQASLEHVGKRIRCRSPYPRLEQGFR